MVDLGEEKKSEQTTLIISNQTTAEAFSSTKITPLVTNRASIVETKTEEQIREAELQKRRDLKAKLLKEREDELKAKEEKEKKIEKIFKTTADR